MTIRYTCDIFCDRCGNWSHGETKEGPVSGMATRTLKKAKGNGWSRDTKSVFTDLCPDCLNHEGAINAIKIISVARSTSPSCNGRMDNIAIQNF